MILKFDFQYLSNNGVLENFLKNIADESTLTCKIVREKNIVSLFIEGNEDELIKFSETISTKLPLSIYFKSTNVEVVEALPETSQEIINCEVEIPFTTKMLEKVLDEKASSFYDPFLSAEIGKSIDANAPLSLHINGEDKEASNSQEYVELFKDIAKHIKNGQSLRVKTKTGVFNLGLIDENAKDKLLDLSFCVMPCDLSVVEKMVVIKDNEIKALASLEKPTLNLRTNMIYKSKEIMPRDFVDIRLADDLILFLICKELYALDVDFIFLTKDEIKTDGEVSFEGNGATRGQIGVSVLENGEILPIFGDAYASKSLKENLKKFETPSHAHFAAIMQEHQLFDKQSCCFYLSKSNDDKIMSYSDENGMLDLINVNPPASVGEMMNMIKASNETGEQLVSNYYKAYPEICAKFDDISIPQDASKSIYTMFGVVGIIFGFADNLKSAADRLLNNAEIFGGSKGPRIDYRLQDESLRSNLDIVKLVRSGMSFRLASTDDLTISFGYLESLSYFVSDMSDSFEENLNTEYVGLCGSMFASKRFSELSSKNIQPNHKVCFNRELPLDM